MADRHHRHQLQRDPIAPGISKARQHLPGWSGARPEAVDMAADRPDPEMPGLLQGPFGPLGHPGAMAQAVFGLVGRQGVGHPTGAIGGLRPAVDLVEVGMGLDHGGQGHQGRRLLVGGRPQTNPATTAVLENHRDQAIVIRARPSRHRGFHKGPRQPQGRQHRHGRPSPARTRPSTSVWRTKNWPAAARVTTE